MSASMVSGNGCIKCGTADKSGVLSCCAHGGAWFENCGDAGNADFDHTWTEGIQACEGVVASTQAWRRHAAVITHPLSTAQSHGVTQRIYQTGNISNGGNTDLKLLRWACNVMSVFYVFISLADSV